MQCEWPLWIISQLQHKKTSESRLLSHVGHLEPSALYIFTPRLSQPLSCPHLVWLGFFHSPCLMLTWISRVARWRQLRGGPTQNAALHFCKQKCKQKCIYLRKKKKQNTEGFHKCNMYHEHGDTRSIKGRADRRWEKSSRKQTSVYYETVDDRNCRGTSVITEEFSAFPSVRSMYYV